MFALIVLTKYSHAIHHGNSAEGLRFFVGSIGNSEVVAAFLYNPSGQLVQTYLKPAETEL